MSPERRSWKHSYDSDFDPEFPSYPPRQDLSEKQKNWIRRAWKWASVALLGFQSPTIPDAIPRYNEQRGWFHVPAIDPDLNHIDGVGESTRLYGDLGYNRPENIAPVSRRNHTGAGVHPLDADEEFIIHRDTYEGRQKYGQWARDGKHGKNPILAANDERKHHTDQGDTYHDTSYDEHMRKLAREVTDGYRQAFPTDDWPKPVKRKKRGDVR